MCLSLAEHLIPAGTESSSKQKRKAGVGRVQKYQTPTTLFCLSPFTMKHAECCPAQHSIMESPIVIDPYLGHLWKCDCQRHQPQRACLYVRVFSVCRCGSVVDSSPSMHGAVSSICSAAEMPFNSISMYACFHRYFSEVGPLGQSFRYISQRASKTAQEVKVCLGFLLL